MEANIPGGMLYVVARRDMSGGIDPRVRSVFEEMITRNQKASGSNAVVVLTTRFAAAMVRGALSSLVALMQRRQMLKVFASVDEACDWLAVQHDLDRDQLRTAFDTATTHLRDLLR